MINNDMSVKLYQSISADNEERPMDMWHASSLAFCPRAQYFKRMGVPALSTPTAAKMLRWKAGHLIEEVIRPHLLKMYPDLKSNVRLTSKKLDLTGEYDNYSEKEKTIFEVKSVHVFAPKMIEASGKPYLSHEYQNHSYKMLLEEVKLPVEKIVYIYIALDGRIVALNTEIQPDILDGLKKRLGLLKEALKTKTPPPCFCKANHPLYGSTMQYCDYRTTEPHKTIEDKNCCSAKLLDKLNKEKIDAN